MSNRPFTIRIYLPDGDPEGIQVIDRMNWTGVGIVFPRNSWPSVRSRREFDRAGIYVLSGYVENQELPRVYIGEADGVRDRIDNHLQNKDFWSKGVVFTSNAGGLNKAHVQWLESVLVERAKKASQCTLENGNAPQLPALSEHEEADVSAFLHEMLQILPLIGMPYFEKPKAVVRSAPDPSPFATQPSGDGIGELDTILVPAQPDGFNKVFLGEGCWHAIRLSAGKIPRIKYIAAYVSEPTKAVTHFARVDRIEPYGENGKYKLVFAAPAEKIRSIPFLDAPSGSMQGPRYTSFKKLRAAKKLTDLF